MAKKKTTPLEDLQMACYKGDQGEVEQLLPLIPKTRNADELKGPIYCAAEQGHFAILKKLIASRPNLKKEQLSRLLGDAVADLACKANTLPAIRHLVALGADIHYKGKYSENAFTNALDSENYQVAEFLKSKGAKWADVTLFHAAEKGDLASAKKALFAGANTEKVDTTFGESVLIAAVRHGHINLARLLLEKGAKVNRKVDGATALSHAVSPRSSTLQMVDLLVKFGANIHERCFGETILMQAAGSGNLSVVKRLVELGANVRDKDRESGKSVLDCAKAGKSKDVIAYLQGLGATADRDAGRALAKALSKEFGGKAWEHSGGRHVEVSGYRSPMTTAFCLSPNFGGWESNFGIGSQGLTLDVYKLRFHDPELQSENGSLILKPLKTSKNGELSLQSVPKSLAAKFTSRLKLLKKLQLSGKDMIYLGSGMARLITYGTDPAATISRLKSFRDFLQTICKPVLKAKALYDKEWLLKPLLKSSAEDKTAGHHFGGTLSKTVACPYCKSDLSLMAQLDLADKTLPGSGLGKLPVFWCLDCAYWDPAFFDLSGETPRALPAQKSEPGVGDDTGPLDARPLTLVPVPTGKKAGRKNKLGGKPAWVQDDETPDCPKCTKQMGFVLQLASDSHVTYADMGMLYAFACPECKISASLVQSH